MRQKTIGLGYELRWRDVGEFSIGAQKSNYRKIVTSPTGALPSSKDDPLLISATGAAYVTDKLAVFGGYTRGLEESQVAPPNASNANEAPPAIRTQQLDVGARYSFTPGVSLIVGLFDLEKPYFNLDSTLRFRRLGVVRNRGVEASLAGQIAKGLTVVAGATYIDSKLSGELVDQGVIGERPIGTYKLRTLATVNWQLPWHAPLTLTARFESTSARTANSANTLKIPARWIASLGARYRTTIGRTPVLFRGTVDNVFNTYGWNVGNSGYFSPAPPRRLTLAAIADF